MCKEICTTITMIATKLEKKFDALSVLFAPALFKLLPVTIKVIAEAAHQCVLSFLKYTSSSVPLIIEGTEHNHQVVRGRCAEYLQFVLENNDSVSYEPFLESIRGSIKRSLQDSSPQARSAARASFSSLKKSFPDCADKLFNELDPSIQKQVRNKQLQFTVFIIFFQLNDTKAKEKTTVTSSVRSFLQQNRFKKPETTSSDEIIVTTAPSKAEPVVQSEPPTVIVKEVTKETIVPLSKTVEDVVVDTIPTENKKILERKRSKKHIEEVETKTVAIMDITNNSTNNKASKGKEEKKKAKVTKVIEEDEEEDKENAAESPKRAKRGSKYAYLLDYKSGETPIAMRLRSKDKKRIGGKPKLLRL